MAPRPPETREALFARARRAAEAGACEVRFGAPHHTHALCREETGWSVRRLVVDQAELDRYRREHATFMPEHAELLSRPGPVVLTAADLEALLAAISQGFEPSA